MDKTLDQTKGNLADLTLDGGNIYLSVRIEKDDFRRYSLLDSNNHGVLLNALCGNCLIKNVIVSRLSNRFNGPKGKERLYSVIVTTANGDRTTLTFLGYEEEAK